uniref:Sorting nexin N-terminal domain-containing protein n=1 Tax=Rhinolophus ferrumequinum TaxID=59479 RepID=A0A671F6B8_RHIFE
FIQEEVSSTEDGKPNNFEEQEEEEDGEDLFTSTVSSLEASSSSPEPSSLLTEDINTNSNSPKPEEVGLDYDRKHPDLLQDPDLRQFLESSELPRTANTMCPRK